MSLKMWHIKAEQIYQDGKRGHPEVVVLDSNDYDMNHKIFRHTWGDGDTEKLQDKVVKNLAKEVHVDKKNAYL